MTTPKKNKNKYEHAKNNNNKKTQQKHNKIEKQRTKQNTRNITIINIKNTRRRRRTRIRQGNRKTITIIRRQRNFK